MTQLPNDDQHLLDFLRQHHPDPPPPALDLEERLMHAIHCTPASATPTNLKRVERWSKPWWMVAPIMAAGLLITLGGDRLLNPPPPSAAELASLEVFLESSWEGVVGDEAVEPAPEWFVP